MKKDFGCQQVVCGHANLPNVELFSAFISHLDDISSWKCSRKCKSLQFERKKTDTKDSRIRTHDPDSPAYYANH